MSPPLESQNKEERDCRAVREDDRQRRAPDAHRLDRSDAVDERDGDCDVKEIRPGVRDQRNARVPCAVEDSRQDGQGRRHGEEEEQEAQVSGGEADDVGGRPHQTGDPRPPEEPQDGEDRRNPDPPRREDGPRRPPPAPSPSRRAGAP